MKKTNRLKVLFGKIDILFNRSGRCFRHWAETGYLACRKFNTRIFSKLKSISSKFVDCKEALAYYSVLAVVLVALSAAAYDYRGRRTEHTVMDSATTPSDGIAVQMQTDPTFSPEITKPAFIPPVHGKIIGEFSDGEPVWSTTLQLWQTHPALDIAASAGEAVVAAADGTITEVYSDAMYGNTIAIEHEDGTVIRYGSLNTLELVKVDQKVEQGQIISSVGTCMAERELGAHIHIECINEEIKSDFLLLLTKSDAENLRD